MSQRNKRAQTKEKPVIYELKDERVFIPGKGTIEKSKFNESHQEALFEAERKAGKGKDEVIQKYFKTKPSVTPVQKQADEEEEEQENDSGATGSGDPEE